MCKDVKKTLSLIRANTLETKIKNNSFNDA